MSEEDEQWCVNLDEIDIWKDDLSHEIKKNKWSKIIRV